MFANETAQLTFVAKSCAFRKAASDKNLELIDMEERETAMLGVLKDC